MGNALNPTLVENLLYARPSGAVHFIGNLAEKSDRYSDFAKPQFYRVGKSSHSLHRLHLNQTTVIEYTLRIINANLPPACAVYVSSRINLAKPKSATFTTYLSPTKQLRAAKSR